MAANTKYQPAPQRDSFEDGNYSQAPPSYQAEGSNNNPLLGQPRVEGDNVPDDFKVYCPVFNKTRLRMDSYWTSLVVPSLRPRYPFGCSSFVRFTRYCELFYNLVYDKL